MHKNITQIRDLEIIESELKSNMAGVLALCLPGDKLVQVATPFMYQDKNIYIFFNSENEVFTNIHFGEYASFTIIRNEKVKKKADKAFLPTYDFISISINGIIKNVEESKSIEELRQNYIAKYKKTAEGEIDFSELSRIVIIDSEEIQAFEETGG